ncbi:hypothetical protein H0H93_001582, partial [Arthromyces matolae]
FPLKYDADIPPYPVVLHSSPTFSPILTPTSSLSVVVVLMPPKLKDGRGIFCGRETHPFIAFDQDAQLIYLYEDARTKKFNIVHPAQVVLYEEFDHHVQETMGNPYLAIPVGYHAFALTINEADPDTECAYRMSVKGDGGHWTRVHEPFPLGFLPTTYLRPEYKPLKLLGLLSPEGIVNERALEDVATAMRTPSGIRAKENHHYMQRKAAQAARTHKGQLPRAYSAEHRRV